MNYIIASSHKNYDSMEKVLNRITKDTFYYFKDKKELNIENINAIKPKYIFFPHWSFIIPKSIYSAYPCIIFHMTDLPFGRGGSPLQNLIVRGIYQTKITAFQCVESIDAGPIYLKKTFSLHGSGNDIFYRLRKEIEQMILILVQNNLKPVPQKGKIVNFKRRVPIDGNIMSIKHIDILYDYIRMLDIDDYPNAFLETKHFRFEFSRATIKMNKIIADVAIYEK